MRLYGMAVAAIQEKDNANIVNIICTPISISSHRPETIDIIERLEFKTPCDLAKPQTVRDCFVQLVDTLDKIVQLQKQSCDQQKITYRPVALHIGEDNRNPVAQLDALYNHLFDAASFDSALSPRHAELYKKLPALLDDCTLKEGSFDIDETLSYKRTAKSGRSTEMDEMLADFNERLKHPDLAYEAHERIKMFARAMGESMGNQTTEHPDTFGLVRDIPVKDDKGMDRYPARQEFYKWDPEYRRAFYEGFDETYQGPHTRKFKLPLDPANPPFVDPCADRIRDELEVVKGCRSEDGVLDRREWRETIADSAKKMTHSLLRK